MINFFTDKKLYRIINNYITIDKLYSTFFDIFILLGFVRVRSTAHNQHYVAARLGYTLIGQYFLLITR